MQGHRERATLAESYPSQGKLGSTDSGSKRVDLGAELSPSAPLRNGPWRLFMQWQGDGICTLLSRVGFWGSRDGLAGRGEVEPVETSSSGGVSEDEAVSPMSGGGKLRCLKSRAQWCMSDSQASAVR